MTSLLLIFRFPNPDRGRAAKTHSGVFFKAAEEKRHVDKLPTHRCCIKAVSSYGITKYCMVLYGIAWYCMPTHLWCIKAVSLLLPCRRPVIPPVSLTALCHSWCTQYRTGKGTVYTNTQKYIHIYKIQIEIDWTRLFWSKLWKYSFPFKKYFFCLCFRLLSQ